VNLCAPKRLALAATRRPARSRQAHSHGLFTEVLHREIASNAPTDQVFNRKILSQISSAASSISRIPLRNKSGGECNAACYTVFKKAVLSWFFFFF
jgi:hypothetical protein